MCFALFLFLTWSFSPLSVLASTNTEVRTEDNYLVPDYVQVTEANKYYILSTPAVDASEKIYDFADLFTDDEEQKLFQQVSNYIKKYDMDLAIVTIVSNEKSSTHTYAEDFYDYNEFGTNSTQDGSLLLIDMDNREIYFQTTGGAISMYNSIRVDQILDDITSYMTDQEYYEGTSKFVTILKNYAQKGLPQSNENRYTINRDGQIVRDIPWLAIFLFSGLATLVIILILVHQNKMVRTASSSREYLNKDSLKIEQLKENFLGSTVTKVPISHDSSSSGGSRGSSGVSHGGGGRKF